ALGSFRALPLLPRIYVRSELTLRELITPVPEAPFRVLLDVSFVNQRNALALVGDCVLDGRADQPLRAFLRDGLDADAGCLGEADLRVRLGPGRLEDLEELPVVLRARFEFDAGVDVLRVLTEDRHVHLLRMLHR